MNARTSIAGLRGLIFGLLAIVMLASACGGDGKPAKASLPTLEATATPTGDDAATSDDGSVIPVSNGAASNEPMTEAEITRVLEEWRDCMLAEDVAGMEVTVALVDGFPETGVDFSGEDEAALIAAEEKCEPLLASLIAQFEADMPSDAEMADQLLDLQKCMAEKGIVIDISDGGVNFNGDEQTQEFTDEEVMAVEEGCMRDIQAGAEDSK